METIVVVDDSRVFARLLSKVLDLEGYRSGVFTPTPPVRDGHGSEG